MHSIHSGISEKLKGFLMGCKYSDECSPCPQSGTEPYYQEEEFEVFEMDEPEEEGELI